LDPLKPDTGNTGRLDGDKDADHDGLSNRLELRKYHTDPANAFSFPNTTKNDAEYLFTASPGPKDGLYTLSLPTFPGGGQISFTITGGGPNDAFDLYFEPSLIGWKWRRVYAGAPGQTKFVLPDPNPGIGFYEIGISSADDDNDGLPN